jgi:hypothetical protein
MPDYDFPKRCGTCLGSATCSRRSRNAGRGENVACDEHRSENQGAA